MDLQLTPFWRFVCLFKEFVSSSRHKRQNKVFQRKY